MEKKKKKSHLKLVTLTAFRNTQTAHHQQNKPQDVSEKKNPCCPQNICYTEYNQVYWLWQFIEFLQCFLELRTVHCCSASRSTVCRVLLLHKKATGISIWMGTRLQTAAQTLPRKEVSWRSLTAHLYPSHPDPHHWDLCHLQLEAVKTWKSQNSEQMFISAQH